MRQDRLPGGWGGVCSFYPYQLPIARDRLPWGTDQDASHDQLASEEMGTCYQGRVQGCDGGLKAFRGDLLESVRPAGAAPAVIRYQRISIW